ncbi:UDP-3-O-acyl-N-acetylglucosamine deacetylase [Pleurocapsales cyanobacterium LEGE 06147]|nr:UDP-3-O-acyl-N-acetylglucosamine deacetylase [Pleurocapsales cyanobacterium LEGE 06147]
MGKTIKESFELSGVGLHSGVTTTVRVVPTQAEAGRYFVRVDLPARPLIPARLEAVSQTTLSTELARGQAKVRTVEHLLAALFGHGVDNARIEIDGAEVPLLDGSAKMWSEAIANVGIASLPVPPSPRLSVPLAEPIWIREEDSFVAALPSSETRFTYGIDFPYQAIGNQWHSWNPQTGNFAEAIAPARTFGFAEAIEQLKQAGLIKGGSLENALVCSDRGWLNPPLRFTNEPARHKLLDLIGDLSLLGRLPQAHFLAYKASHKLHIQLAQKLANLFNA